MSGPGPIAACPLHKTGRKHAGVAPQPPVKSPLCVVDSSVFLGQYVDYSVQVILPMYMVFSAAD